jgi:Arc/MetJ family transcription regulator
MGDSSIDTHIDTGYCMGINSLRTGGDTMKTTIEIDQQLLRQAQKTLGTDTIKGTVEASLRTVIQRSQLQKLADALGRIPLDLTPGQLRSQRHKRPSHVSR